MVSKLTSVLAIALLLISCERTVDQTPGDQAIIAAELYVDAFYSFDSIALQVTLSSAEESLPEMLFYQGWAKGGNYEVIERMPCELGKDETINCSITVKDDLIGALGIDFNVTDTFHISVSGGQIVAVNNSSNDPQAYWDAEIWVRNNKPELIERPCKGFFDGGPTPGDCVRAMVRGYSEFANQTGRSDGSVTSE
ncbi:MAG: hypothetical protein GXP15_09830 [Gammaproteobacteria bacterium]|nr:hypothetical protein [Gammaproteobacteria bacterium]